jgi:hypothetical protein
MRRVIQTVAVVIILFFVFSFTLSFAADAQYIGAAKCKMCHVSKKSGEQYVIWQNSAHAKAYTTLATEEAKAVAKKASVEGDPQSAAACLKCHVTAFEAPASAKAASFDQTEGVGCESCHGPGSLYKSMTVMKGLAAGTQNPKAVGFLKADEATCKKCHNESSPTYKPFTFAEKWKVIAHPVPKEKE